MFYLLFFLIFLIGAFSNELQAQTKVLNNGALRFGTGSENSLNTQGNLQQPFVYNLDLNQWRKLTFGTHPLNLSIAVGGNGENEWNLNGTRFDNPTPSNKVDDYSDFTFTTAPNGYGIIVTRGDITISHSGTTYNLELENKYELRDDKSYLKVTSTIRNTGATTLTNLRYWVGTPDDWIGTSDAPRKERGNIVDGAFVQISAVSERALAQRVTSGQEGVMFYSNSEKANNTIATSYGWTNIINQNPFTAPIDIGGDRAYAFYVRMYDVAPGQSDSFTWYYAAGRLSDLDAIIADVAADIAANTNENIAPILDNSQNPVLTTIEKNSFTSNGNTISEIVVDGSITDEDGFLGKAVAVIGTDNSNGAWQFSLDAGVSWQAVLNASDENALLLGPDDKLRFVPNADWFGTSTFTFRAWDRSDGSAGDYWNTQGGGGSLPFSVLFDDATITVMDVLVNNAPVLDPAYTHLLSSITTNNTTNSGNSVTEIVADGSITDPDGPAFKSIAVIGVDDLNGVWQYSLNSIAWSAIAPVSNNSALLLDANHRIRFIPNSDWTGVSTFTFRAWDKTSGVSGNKVDVSVNGNPTAFSIASDIASITVAFANNAPILNVGDNAPFLAPINMNNFNSSGNTINEIIPDGAITDPDGPIAKAVAAFDFDNTNGMWQYSANNGATWIDATVATQGNAILFDSNYRVRFVPVSDWYGTPIFMIRAWDKSAGTPGERANASLNGSNHPFSSAESPIYINVKQVLPPVAPVANDATLISTTGFTANWSASSGATSYRLDVSTNSGFSSFVADYEDKELGNVLSIEITGLTAGNTYYYRVRAGGIGGIGDNSNIITTITTPPAPVANDATLISTTGFTANWSAANGAASYRLDVSTNNVFSDYVSGYEGKVLGNVTSSVVSGLTAGNTYYYRVRTVNSGGTSVNSNTITTVTHHLPTVTTQAVSSINTTTATGNGNITALGVPNPTQHGHVWSTSTNPTLSSHVGGGVSTIGVASVTGAFTSSITGLTIGPVYYVRAYATNSAGTVYGAEVSFTTHQVPTVTTQEVSSINTTTATGNGNITALGVPNPTQHGHVWNTEEDPTTSNSKTEKGAVSSTGAFTSSITELTPGTVYYVKAYATNSSGTVYGAQVSFRTTPPAPKNLAFELNKKQSVKFTWSDDDEAENLTGYQIALQSSDFSETQVVIADFTTPSAIRVYDYTPENPFASGEHDYKIRARYNFFGSEFLLRFC